MVEVGIGQDNNEFHVNGEIKTFPISEAVKKWGGGPQERVGFLKGNKPLPNMDKAASSGKKDKCD